MIRSHSCKSTAFILLVYILLLETFVIVLAAKSASQSSSSSSSTVTTTRITSTVGKSNEKETLAIKNKLATAEGRVSDLISRLDTVSTDATRAKGEIHTTLMEVWKVVDLLGKDQCGSVVEKVRIAQKNAESRILTLQDENSELTKDAEQLKLIIAKAENTEAAIQTELKAERTRRETTELEIRELRDKLHWANIMGNESKTYEIVSERLQSLLVMVSERTSILNRIMTMFSDAHQGFNDWQNEISALTGLVRDSERQFIDVAEGAAVESLKRQITDLENRLINAEAAREDVRRQRDDARSKLEKVSKQQFQQQHQQTMSSVTNQVREAVIRKTSLGSGDSDGNNWFGWITFGILSCGTGIIATSMLSVWNNKNQENINDNIHQQAQIEQTNFGFTPTSSPGRPRTPSSTGIPPGTSPLTYVDRGSGSRTPGSRNSTPRRY